MVGVEVAAVPLPLMAASPLRTTLILRRRAWYPPGVVLLSWFQFGRCLPPMLREVVAS